MTIKLPKNRMEFLIDEMERRIKLPVLERGWDYFHRGFVMNPRLTGGCILEAEVRGKEAPLQASLNLEKFDKSACTCSYEGVCKHMAALLFHAYAQHGRPELLLLQMKQAIHTRRRSKSTAAAKAERTAEALSAMSRLTPEAAPKEWIHGFDQRFHGYTLSNQHSVEQFMHAVWDSLGNKAKTWPATLQELYQLHLILYVQRKVEAFHLSNDSTYLSFYIENGCKHVAGQCWLKLRELDAGGWRLADPKERARYPKHWKETLTIVEEMVTSSAAEPVHWLDVYRFLWSRLLASDTAAIAHEKKRLSQLLERNRTPRTRDRVLLAAAHFDMMEGKDADAMERLSELNNRSFSDFYLILEQLADQEQWGRLLLWLRWLLPALAKAKQEEFMKGCAFWVEAVKHQPTDEEWIRVMLSLLPRSYAYYTEYLMETKRYRQWVDLQLAAGVTPSNLYSAELRKVEAADPSLLLPLFHQSVEKAVMEKNRDSYKLAIRLMKKLHLLYRQMGQPDRWQDYLERLSVKYARLRAFKEELSKGQWTS